MTDIHPDIERLINRALDGALDEDQQVELSRALLRDPQAHRLHDDYRTIDDLAGAALRGSLAQAGPAFDPMTLTEAPAPAKRGLPYHRAWWLMPAAAAALLVFSILGPTPDAPPVGPGTGQHATNAFPGVSKTVGDAAPHKFRVGDDSGFAPLDARTVGYGPQSIKRITDRDMLGVVGADGKVYWLEVDRTRTLTKPKTSGDASFVVGDM